MKEQREESQKRTTSNILFNTLLHHSQLDAVSVLYGYLLTNLDLEHQASIIDSFKKVFIELKEKGFINRKISKKNVVLLVYDIIEEIRTLRRGDSEHRMEDFPLMLYHNINETIRDEMFIEEKWDLLEDLMRERREEQKKKRYQGEVRGKQGEVEIEQTGQEGVERQAKEYHKQKKGRENKQIIIISDTEQKEELRRKTEQKKIHEEQEEKRGSRERAIERERTEIMKQEKEAEYILANMEEQLKYKCLSCNTGDHREQLIFLGCDHSVHPDCLKGYLQAMVESNLTVIICPKPGCDYPIPNNQILQLLGSEPEIKGKYDQNLMFEMVSQNRETMAWCPGEGCRAILSYQEGDIFYKCDQCNFSYCLRCGCKQHTDFTCSQFQSRRPPSQLKIDYREPKFKKCPTCSSWVERRKDTLRMRCICGQEFCYVCRERGCEDRYCRLID